MKHSIKTFSLLATATCLTISSLSAVETDPVGYVTADLPAGTHTISVPLNKPAVGNYTVTSVNGSEIGLNGTPTLAGPSYLHVVESNAALGEFSTILSTGSNTISLESEIPSLSPNDVVAVREHFTLNDLSEASDGGVPNNSNVTFYNSDGSTSSYSSIDGDWFLAGQFTPTNDAIIFPGEGVALNLQAATSFVFVGAVNVDPVVIPVTSGVVSLVGSLNPSEGVGNNSIGEILAGLGNNSSITIYSGDGTLSVVGTYSLIDGEWYPSGSFVPEEVTITAPATVVVNSQTTNSATLTPAFVN